MLSKKLIERNYSLDFYFMNPSKAKLIPVEDNDNPNESPVYQNNSINIEYGGKLVASCRSLPDAKTTIELIKGCSITYANQDFYGERIVNQDGSFGHYKWQTYFEIYEQVKKFGRGLISIGISKGDKLGIYSHNCTHWNTSCFGSQLISAIPVPVYDSLGPNAAQFIINHSECKTVVVHPVKLQSLLQIITETPNLKSIIIIGEKPSDIQSSIQIYTINEIIELGVTNDSLTYEEPTPDDIGIIIIHQDQQVMSRKVAFYFTKI